MIKENQRLFNWIFAIVDALICFMSMTAAYLIRFNLLTGITNGRAFGYYFSLLPWIIPAYYLCYRYFGLHETFRYKSFIKEAGKIMQANTAGVVFVFLLIFMLKDVDASRLTILLFAAINVTLTAGERFILRRLLRAMRRSGYNLKHLLIVGWNEVSGEFYDKIRANKNLGYKVHGYIGSAEDLTDGKKPTYLGGFSELSELLTDDSIDEVVISLDFDEFPFLGDIIEACEKQGVKSSLLPFYTKYLPTRPVIDEVEGMPLINIRRTPLDNLFNSFIKRGFDIVASACGLVLLSPLLAFTAICVRASSPGGAIYRQTRIGRNKKEFTMYKFRSMSVEGNNDKTEWGTRRDARRTGFGSFIRKFSIDELPQLFNVLRGDMSLVGPRPERPFFVEKFRDEVPLYMLKHLVRPGITGWAQVNGWRGDTSIVERVKCDIYYIENWTFLMDIKIVFMTVFRGIINPSEDL